MSLRDIINGTVYMMISHWMFPDNISNKTSAHHTLPHIQKKQRCTKPRGPVAAANKFCMLVPNIRGCSEWTSLHVTLLAPRILRWFLEIAEDLCIPEQKCNDKTCENINLRTFL